MNHDYVPSKCVLHPDRVAITTVSHVPVCRECEAKYQAEGTRLCRRGYTEDRPFYQEILRAGEQQTVFKR